MKPTLKRLISTFTVFMCACALCAQTDYERLEGKAARFFDNQEWASANAMYLLMLEQQPHRADTYGKAVVAEIMAGDTVQALDMVPRSMSFEVPVDSLLAEVKRVSFSIGHGNLYEHYLMGIRKTYPWFGRVADNYLMQYYAFRQNGPELIRYANTMLQGLPDNLNFMRMLAYGLLLDGDTEGAVNTWLKVAELYPDNYDTVLDLANCYEAQGKRAEALAWMRRAYEMHPTPYVGAMVDTLSDQ